ncbi:MAG: helix-turn-helix transcriptional regulator [Fimbriimonadaceae bacterium]|nr:helix-turn-helix transcriptional regulator [Fimbriimonadaceae bacterium]QYK55986.1 MAG: helix-turn-helix transcriptional regulator [Fimbriimonadaceae bacterium]
MPPCPSALTMARIPAKKWGTREDVLRRLEGARRILDEAQDRHSLPELARLADLSPYHFHRLFREAYGLTPQTYLRRRRLERAVALLKEGWAVNAVCAEIGFSSPSSFHRAYRKQFGHAPGATLVGLHATKHKISKPGQSDDDGHRQESRP